MSLLKICKNDDIESLKEYIEKNGFSNSIFLKCLKYKSEKCLDYLKSVVDIDSVDDDGNTILHKVAKMTKKALEFVLEFNPDPTIKNNNDEIPLYLATKKGNKSILEKYTEKHLIEIVKEIHDLNNDFMNEFKNYIEDDFFYFVKETNIEIFLNHLKEEIDELAEDSDVNDILYKYLIYASINNRGDILDLILNKFFNGESLIPIKDGRTIHFYISDQKLFLKYNKIYVNYKDDNCACISHYAAIRGLSDIIDVLLCNSNFDKTIEDKYENTFLDYINVYHNDMFKRISRLAHL